MSIRRCDRSIINFNWTKFTFLSILFVAGKPVIPVQCCRASAMGIAKAATESTSMEGNLKRDECSHDAAATSLTPEIGLVNGNVELRIVG